MKVTLGVAIVVLLSAQTHVFMENVWNPINANVKKILEVQHVTKVGLKASDINLSIRSKCFKSC